MNELREKVRKAVAALLVKQPFVGVLAKNTWILYDPSSPFQAYTDGLRIYLGPTAASMDAKALSEAIAHEVLHIALKHPLRGRDVAERTGLPQWLLNVIADAIVNDYMEKAGLLDALKSVAVTPQRIEEAFGVEVEGRSFEEVAMEIAKKLQGAAPRLAFNAGPTLGEDIYAQPKGGGAGSGEARGESGEMRQRGGERGQAGSQKDGAARRDEGNAPPSAPHSGSEEGGCLLYTSPSPRDGLLSRMPSSA